MGMVCVCVCQVPFIYDAVLKRVYMYHYSFWQHLKNIRQYVKIKMLSILK